MQDLRDRLRLGGPKKSAHRDSLSWHQNFQKFTELHVTSAVQAIGVSFRVDAQVPVLLIGNFDMEEDVVLVNMVASVLQLAHPEVIAVIAEKCESELHSSLATTSMVLLRFTMGLRNCVRSPVSELTWRLSPQLRAFAIF